MDTPTLYNTAKGRFCTNGANASDPLRAKFIAETYLEDARLVNNVRSI